MLETKIRRQSTGRNALGSFDKFDDVALRNSIYEVGIVDGSIAYDDGTPVADVAFWNEFGTDTGIPARPALRTAVADSKKELRKVGRLNATKIVAGQLRFDAGMRQLARIVRDAMKLSILEWSTPPNAPSTIKRKGFDDPLIDTGLYHDSIDFKLLKTRKDQIT